MITQIEEKEIAVITFSVDPPGKADLRTGIFGAKFAAVMGAVRMHSRTFTWNVDGVLTPTPMRYIPGFIMIQSWLQVMAKNV